MTLHAPATLRLPPLTKRGMGRLVAGARRMGVAPEDYAKRLIEEGLAVELESRKKTFAEIMRPVRERNPEASEDEVVKLVQAARADSKRRATVKRG